MELLDKITDTNVKINLKEIGSEGWIGLMWLMAGSSGDRLFVNAAIIVGLHKRRRISWPAETFSFSRAPFLRVRKQTSPCARHEGICGNGGIAPLPHTCSWRVQDNTTRTFTLDVCFDVTSGHLTSNSGSVMLHAYLSPSCMLNILPTFNIR